MDAELTLYKKDEITGGYFIPDYSYFADNDNEFELIEDEVDIDNIEEYEVDKTDTVINRNKINELVQALKQLNKEIKELKEKI